MTTVPMARRRSPANPVARIEAGNRAVGPRVSGGPATVRWVAGVAAMRPPHSEWPSNDVRPAPLGADPTVSLRSGLSRRLELRRQRQRREVLGEQPLVGPIGDDLFE